MASGAALRATWRLGAILSDGLARRSGVTVARWLARSLTLGYGAMLLIVARGSTGGDVTDVIATHALFWLTWLPGSIAALSVARSLEQDGTAPGLSDLVRARGVACASLDRARQLAGALCMARVLGPPALALALLSLLTSPSLTTAGLRVLLGAATALYVASLAALLGALSAACASLAPGRARSALAASVVVPWVVGSTWPIVPSLPAAVDWCLELMIRIGGAA